MNNLEKILDIKLEKAVKTFKKSREDNLRLKAELEFLRKESEVNRKKMGEFELLKSNVASSAVKIERLLKKIDTLKA